VRRRGKPLQSALLLFELAIDLALLLEAVAQGVLVVSELLQRVRLRRAHPR
jgi:hypothetical protein